LFSVAHLPATYVKLYDSVDVLPAAVLVEKRTSWRAWGGRVRKTTVLSILLIIRGAVLRPFDEVR
jgi:hypothetical protein